MIGLFFIVVIVGLVVLHVILSIWVFFDARTRKSRSLFWSLLTLISGPFIALPPYFAYRNLKTGEVRIGGTVWHIIRNYTLSWTAFMVMVIFASLVISVSLGISEAENLGISGYEIFAASIAAWLFITLCMMVLGLFVRQSSIVDRGSSEPVDRSAHPDL
ncbi:MAG: hypothetical protein OXS28_12825 [Gammaproteobacteria bacterium]|nr:hypothetical protein [Gammaproteobacteria bacterium]